MADAQPDRAPEAATGTRSLAPRVALGVLAVGLAFTAVSDAFHALGAHAMWRAWQPSTATSPGGPWSPPEWYGDASSALGGGDLVGWALLALLALTFLNRVPAPLRRGVFVALGLFGVSLLLDFGLRWARAGPDPGTVAYALLHVVPGALAFLALAWPHRPVRGLAAAGTALAVARSVLLQHTSVEYVRAAGLAGAYEPSPLLMASPFAAGVLASVLLGAAFLAAAAPEWLFRPPVQEAPGHA